MSKRPVQMVLPFPPNESAWEARLAEYVIQELRRYGILKIPDLGTFYLTTIFVRNNPSFAKPTHVQEKVCFRPDKYLKQRLMDRRPVCQLGPPYYQLCRHPDGMDHSGPHIVDGVECEVNPITGALQNLNWKDPE